MDLQRLKSIDIFRGVCIIWIVFTHLVDWWLKNEFNWVHRILIMIFDPIGASGLLFISGVSITLSYRNRLTKINTSEDYTSQTVRNSYLIRALLIFIIALIYNTLIAIALKDPVWIWTWFVLLTASISMFIAWPLFKTPKFIRIILGVIIWIANPFIVSLLLPFEGSLSAFGILFHILYHGLHQVPLLVFFPFFLFGTVVGEVLFDSYFLDHSGRSKRKTFGYNYLAPVIAIGILLIILGVLFKYPNFLLRESLSWVIYSLGINIVIISILLSIDAFEIIKTKKSYKLLFYFSYYSLTIFLAHNILHFLFLNQLDVINLWFLVVGTFLLIIIILRIIYKFWNGTASIKVLISRISNDMTKKLVERSNNKQYSIPENKVIQD
ncbi:MAG: acyltransferase family protein [Promethearchaeota archaeon]